MAVQVMVEGRDKVSRIRAWYDGLAPGLRDLVDHADRTGLTAAFVSAWNACYPQEPTNPAKTLLAYFSSMTRCQPHSASLLAMQQHFRSDEITVLRQQQIAAIFVDGSLRLFVPINIVEKPPKVDPAGKIQVKNISAKVEAFDNWIKTKMGYVPAEAQEFARAIRKRSHGEFADVGL